MCWGAIKKLPVVKCFIPWACGHCNWGSEWSLVTQPTCEKSLQLVLSISLFFLLFHWIHLINKSDIKHLLSVLWQPSFLWRMSLPFAVCVSVKMCCFWSWFWWYCSLTAVLLSDSCSFLQGSHTSLKVLEFFILNSRPWKYLKTGQVLGSP